MNRYLVISAISALLSSSINAMDRELPVNPFQKAFEYAYSICPQVPRGLLEAVAYTNTRFHHIQHSDGDRGGCTGMPLSYGVMGLVADGKGYFRDNLKLVSSLSGIEEAEIKSGARSAVLAYALAYQHLLQKADFPASLEEQVPIIKTLMALPGGGNGREYARAQQLYAILTFLNTPAFQRAYGFSVYHIKLEEVFGSANLRVLSSHWVQMRGDEVSGEGGSFFTAGISACNDYTNCLWVPADASNYSSRNGSQITAVTIHDVEGTYAGCISWFQNPNANVSAHYVLRSSDGQITQMVCEIDKAWHVGSENAYTIGFEHEGYASQQGWYTVAMYTASADLVRDICNSGYGINPHRTAYFPWSATTYYSQSGIPGSCVRIKGHQHYPNQTHTDPGPNWDWDYYYKLININPQITLLSSDTGQLYDSGGPNGNYGDDERKLWLIQPPNADTITLEVDSFSLEQDWDYLYIYDGASEFDTLLGYYTGTSIPASFSATSGSMLIEFRSDCAVNAGGWAFSWTSTFTDTTTRAALGTSATDCRAFPNPFGNSVSLAYFLQKAGKVVISLSDPAGQVLSSKTLNCGAGAHRSTLQLEDLHLANGMYFISIRKEDDLRVFKMIRSGQ